MAQPFTALVVVMAALGAFASSPSLAHAETPTAQATALATAPASAEQAGHHFLFGQALAILVRRVAVGYELLPAPHHSFGITVHGQWPGTKYLSIAHGEVAGFGGEIGYRYYADEHRPTGPFFAVSFLSGYYYSRSSFLESDPTALWYTQYGWAVDMGWSFAIERTTIIALGAGVQRTWIDVTRAEITDHAQLSNGEGLRPRAQFQVGRVF